MDEHEAWHALVIGLLGASALLHAAGTWRLWRGAGVGHGARPGPVAAFAAGWAVTALALLSPLHEASERSFAAHMVQHELLMVVAAPLFVLGRPLGIWLWALPEGARRAVGSVVRGRAVQAVWQRASDPLVAWVVHGAVLWLWHVPALFAAVLESPALHALQHACFLVSALLFWWAPLVAPARAGIGASLFYVFTTMLHTGALGALLTFAPTPWYLAGDDALADQQLGGLVMWVPGGAAYLVAGLAIAARTLQARRLPLQGHG